MNEQIIIPALTGLTVIAVGGAILIGKQARRAPMQARLRGVGGDAGYGGSIQTGSAAGGLHVSDLVGSVGSAVSSGKTSKTLQQQLLQAGYHNSKAALVYVGAKMLLMITGIMASATLVLPTQMVANTKILLIAISAASLFFIPNIIVAGRRSSRRSEIRRHLPDAVDLLEICASAGMGLDMAWNSVTDEVRSVSPTLADEMALTNLEIHLGEQRAVAMRHMAERTGAEELSSLVAVLVQSERFGTSISDSLRIYATSMREERSQHAQESAEKLAVKLIFPMVAFIFPSVVLIMAGPGFMSLYKALHSTH